MGEAIGNPESSGTSGDRYTMAEAARVKGVSYHTVSRAVRSGKLPAQRLGRMALIAAQDLQAWRPMRERAPHKYRRPEPSDQEQQERPVLADAASEMPFADRLVLAGEQLLEVASSQSIAQFGDWLAQWLATSLRVKTVVVWQLDQQHGAPRRYGVYGADTVPARLDGVAASMLADLAEGDLGETLDSSTLKQLGADSWLPPDDGQVLFLPLRANVRCVGCAFARLGEAFTSVADEELAFAQRLATHAAFAIEHVALRQREQQAVESPALLDELPLQVFKADHNGTLVYVSDAVLEQWGEDVRETYVGRHFTHVVRSIRCETLDGVEVRHEDHPFTRALRGENVGETPVLVPDAFGESRVFALSARPTHDEQGMQSGAVAIVRDITSEFQAIDSGESPIAMLAEARRRVELLADLSMEIAQHRETEDIFGIVASRACDVLGADASVVVTPTDKSHMVVRATHNMSESIGGQVVSHVSFPNALLTMAQRDLLYVNEEESGSGARAMFTDTGTRSALLIPLLDADEALGVLAVFYADVDRLRQVDPELARAVGRQCGHAVQLRNVVVELDASRRRLLTTLDQLPQAVVILDERDGQIVAMNRESEVLWGSGSNLVGKHADEIVMLDEHGHEVPAERHPFLRPLETQRSEFGVPLVTRDASGNMVDVFANLAPVIDRAGELRGAVAVMQRREHFKPVEQAKDEFVSVVAHELRNPLTSLRGNLQLLMRRLSRMDGEESERESERVEGVIQQVDRIGELVSRMLDVSRADLGKLTIDPVEADAVQLARSAITDVGGQVEDRSIVLNAPESVAVEWDPVRVQQILVNLLTNAVRYAPEGDIHVSVSTNDRDRVSISVRDHGPGIPLRLRRRLFRLYYRFDDGEETQDGLATQQRGLGIGLYISARLAKAHGGGLSVDDAEGGGAVFTMTLPRVSRAS